MGSLFPDFSAHPLLLGFLVVANWPLYRSLALILFSDAEGFKEAIEYWIIPDIWSLFRNRYFDDAWAEIKLGLWVIFCIGSVVAEYRFLAAILDWWYEVSV